MNNENLQIGDIVVPKSGGNKMTIIGFTETGNCICMWLQNGKKFEENFPKTFLRLYKPDNSGFQIVSLID